MAQMHKGVAIGVAGIVLAGVGAAGVIGFGGGSLWSMAFGEEEQLKPTEPAPFQAVMGEEPQLPPEKKDPPQETTKHIQTRDTTRTASNKGSETKQASLSEGWLKRVNEGGLYAFGKDNGYSGVNNSEAECSTSVPVRVVAMIADSATTDVPGMALGMISNDVQGTDSSGEYCIAIPGGAVVTFDVQKAGEYATNRVPTQVNTIWMHDEFKVEVNQPAKHIDGIPGVIGKANHHTFSKTMAAIGSVAFGLANNVTRAFSFNSSEVTNPVEDSMRKTLERPSEVTFTGGKVVEFDLMPTSTPGY